MLSIITALSQTVYQDSSELAAAVSGAVNSWANALALPPTGFTAADFTSVTSMGQVAHVISRKMVGVPALKLIRRSGATETFATMTSLVTAFESDYNSDPSTGWFFMSLFEALRYAATQFDNLVVTGASELITRLQENDELTGKQFPVYRRTIADPRFGDVPWISSIFDWPLRSSVGATEVQFYLDGTKIEEAGRFVIENVYNVKLDRKLRTTDLLDVVYSGLLYCKSATFGYTATKNAYMAANGGAVNVVDADSIVNALLSMRHYRSLGLNLCI